MTVDRNYSWSIVMLLRTSTPVPFLHRWAADHSNVCPINAADNQINQWLMCYGLFTYLFQLGLDGKVQKVSLKAIV